jgi:hypothetical protein
MAWLNAAGLIYGSLETSGVINLLGTSKAGGVAVIAITAINALAHAFSPPVPGPLAPTKTG